MTNVSGVTSNTDINKMIEQINALKSEVESKINKAKSDYGDDGLFNASVEGSQIGTTDLTMDAVNEMSFSELNQLLETPLESDINRDLEIESNNLASYIETYNRLISEIDALEASIQTLTAEIAKAENEKASAEALVRRYESVKSAAEDDVLAEQQNYERACANKESAMEQAEQDAYDEAIEEYAEKCAELRAQNSKDNGEENDETNYNEVSFNEILEQKRSQKCLHSRYDTAIADAAQRLGDKKKVVKRYTNLIDMQNDLINEKTTLISTKTNAKNAAETNLANKQADLMTVQTNISDTQRNMDGLEQTMATRNFVNDNVDAIRAKVYEKDPEVISNKSTINSAKDAIDAQLSIAQQAEKDAKTFADNGEIEKANAEKQKAEEAKAKAAEEKAKAESAKQALINKYGDVLTAQAVDKANGLTNSVSNIQTKVDNIASEITKAEARIEAERIAKEQAAAAEAAARAEAIKKNEEKAAVREAAGAVFAESVDEVSGEATKDVQKLDLTQMLSADELALVKNKNIDLTEVNEASGGYPRYVVAKAADGKYHIYEREFDNKNKPKSTLSSLARKYGSKKGYDIIANGSGYMNNTKEVEESAAGAKEVFVLTCVSDDFKSCEYLTAYKSYTTGSPLSLDLNGDGVRTSDKIISYDIDGDGTLDKINDSLDAVLVFDKDGDGIVGKDGSECFGNNTDLDGDGKADGYKDGFEALKALALKENLINKKDDMQLDENDIKLLDEKYGFKIKANGYNSQAQSLADLGITAINLANTDETNIFDNFDSMGNQLMTQEGATFVQNGEEKEYADIWHRYEDKNAFLKLTLCA